ncbi:MAG: hypothetical protein ABW185_27230 [Sedimenticola sp.]
MSEKIGPPLVPKIFQKHNFVYKRKKIEKALHFLSIISIFGIKE